MSTTNGTVPYPYSLPPSYTKIQQQLTQPSEELIITIKSAPAAVIPQAKPKGWALAQSSKRRAEERRLKREGVVNEVPEVINNKTV